MRIFGNPIGIIVGSSASLAAGSSSLDQPFQALNFTYLGPYDISTTGSVASIETILISASNSTGSGGGVAGALSFKVSDPSNLNTTGSEVMRMFITSSEPRVGIGFNSNESILKALDIKSKSNTDRGTDLLIRSSRLTEGAQTGDEGGSINFVIDSGSYNDITTTGSIARIKTKVDNVTADGGVSGRLLFTVARGTSTEVDAFQLGYGEGTFPNFYTAVLSSSIEVKDVGDNADLKDHNTITHTYQDLPATIIGVDYAGTENSGGYIQVNDGEGTGSIFLHGSSGEITASLVSASNFRVGNQIRLTDSISDDYIAYESGNGFFYKGKGRFLGTITGSNLQLTGVPAQGPQGD